MDFLRMNPAGQVPVLRIDDLVLADSTAIFEYLEETHPEPPLLPKSPALRAEARRLTAWFDDKFHNEVTANLVYERVNKKLAKTGYPGEREDQGRDAQHQVPPRLYRLADGPPALAGRRHADDRRLRGGGASLLPRLCERRRLDAERRACTSGTPRSSRGRRSARSSPTWCRGSPRRSTMRTSTSEMDAAGQGARPAAEGARAEEGFAACGICAPDAIPEAAGRLAAFVAAGWHGQMRWMAERMGWRGSAGGALAGGAVGDHAGGGLYAGGGSAGGAGAARPRGDQRLCAGARLSRPGQEAAEAAGALAGGGDRGGDQGLRRHRAGDGEAAGAGGGDRLAGQAHQPAQPGARATGSSSARSSPRWSCRGTRRGRITAGRAGPASTSARPGRCRRPTGSMRGAASAT